MSTTLVLGIAVATGLLVSRTCREPREESLKQTAYILESQVTHARLLPEPSSHAFSYSTLSFLLSLNSLESHELDLWRGWVFGYDGLFFRLTGLRPSAYLTDAGGPACSIREKLLGVLAQRGHDPLRFRDAWMMSMPSYLGFEGINPLTVYFCYDGNDNLWLVVLEVHNTFGERHAYTLEIGRAEDASPATGFSHQWTFPRRFHVSPFNDRSGFYTVAVTPPSHPPRNSQTDPERLHDMSLPVVRIHLHTPGPIEDVPGALKLTAVLRARSASPLMTRNLLTALAKRPFVLLLSMARILYHAWVLHYKKMLDVYVRPEPHPAVPGWGAIAGPDIGPLLPPSGGVGWQAEAMLDKYARSRVEAFLRQRVDEVGISVTLVSANPLFAPQVFSPIGKTSRGEATERDRSAALTIWYLSPQLFVTLLLAPSAAHTLLLGYHTERFFVPSSLSLFAAVFGAHGGDNSHDTAPVLTVAQRMRANAIPRELMELPGYTVPATHPLDPPPSHAVRNLLNITVIWAVLALARVERLVYRLSRARFVRGEEPWGRWDRALDAVKLREAVGVDAGGSV